MHKKVAFIGSVGSGKTTIIESLSSIHTVNTDVQSSVDIGKEMTTVGIDYGHITINNETTLGLYGNNDPESMAEITHLIEYFEVSKGMPCVIGVTHADQGCDQNTLKQINAILDQYDLHIPVYPIDPRQRSSANLIMQTMIALEEVES